MHGRRMRGAPFDQNNLRGAAWPSQACLHRLLRTGELLHGGPLQRPHVRRPASGQRLLLRSVGQRSALVGGQFGQASGVGRECQVGVQGPIAVLALQFAHREPQEAAQGARQRQPQARVCARGQYLLRVHPINQVDKKVEENPYPKLFHP